MKKQPTSTKHVLQPQLKEGQNVTVIGLGGVGSIVARYAAVFLASLQKEVWLDLVDGDRFEPGNASRMLFGRHGNKAKVVRRELLPRFKNSKMAIVPYDKYVTPSNIGGIIQEKNIALLCVDNHATRKMVSDHCAKLKNICLISGGNDGVGKDSTGTVRRGTYGNVQIYVKKNGKEQTYALTDFHPEIAQPKDKLPNELNCTELVLSTPQILFSNLAVASAMLNTMLLYLSGETRYSELSFDIAEALQRPTIGVKP